MGGPRAQRSGRSKVKVLALVIVSAVASSALVAQAAPVRVKHEVKCAECRIALTPVKSFGTRNDPVEMGPFVNPAMDSRGRLFAANRELSQVVVFDSSGRFLTAVGRRGRGPGEFGGSGISQILIGRGDSIFVLHDLRRLSVFSPALQFVRTVQLLGGLFVRTYALANGTFAVGAALGSRDHAGLPYHVVNPLGEIVRSFGDSRVNDFMNDPRYANRTGVGSADFVVSPDQRSIWISPTYRVQQWALDGALLRDFEVYDTPWFPPPVMVRGVNRMGRSVVRATGGGSVTVASIDRAGMLWINAVRSPGGTTPGEPVRAIEVFDPVRGVLLASERTEHILNFVRDGFALSGTEDSQGTVTHTLWRVELRGNEPNYPDRNEY